MTITSIRIFLNQDWETSDLKANVTVVLNSQLLLRSLRLVERNGALRILYPGYVSRNNKHHMFYSPATPEFREKLQNKIIEAFEMAKKDPEKHIFEFTDEEITKPQISNIRLFPRTMDDSMIVAVASFTLDGEMWFNRVELKLNRLNAYYLNFPDKVLPQRRSVIYRPLSHSTIRGELLQAILSEYDTSRAG